MKRLLRAAADSEMLLRLSSTADCLLMRTAASRRSRGTRRRVLLAPPADGNVGDMAMVQCLVEGDDSPLTLACEVPGTLKQFEETAGLERLDLGHLVQGFGLRHLIAVYRLGRTLASAHEFIVVGADMMDGGYGRRGAFRRWSLARSAAKCGMESRIVGFSLNASPDRVVMGEARRADKSGVASLLRDPVSFARSRSVPLERAVEVKDVVFSGFIEETCTPRVASLLERLRCRPFAIVNGSGLIQNSFDQRDDYRVLLEGLRGSGLTIVLLPHVSHDGSDDIGLLSDIAGSNPDGIHLVDSLWMPGEILALTSEAKVVVTGRMHLAILALLKATPVAVLSTQGKVEGLMRDAGLEAYCVEPRVGMGEDLVRAALRIVDEEHQLRPRLVEIAGRFRHQALRNFPSSAKSA